MQKNWYIIVVLVILSSCNGNSQDYKKENKVLGNQTGLEYITLGGGCFWCVEAVYQNIKGVVSVTSGYTGGKTENPTYKEVCTGKTNHAEVAKIGFDPKIVSLEEILEVFFATHDPTTLNRQGADAGTQYRSAIFYSSDEQKNISQKVIDFLTKEKVFPDPIVTEITPLGKFYVAEDYHQNYFNNNPNQSYCVYVINPKIQKLKAKFKNKLK